MNDVFQNAVAFV